MAVLPRLSWSQALAWRMRRQFLGADTASTPVAVAERLCGVQAQVPSAAELGIRIRCPTAGPGCVDAALATGALLKTWAMRGTLHLLEPTTGAAFLALVAAARSWERPSWERAFGATPAVIERLREVVSEALASGPKTRAELADIVGAVPELAHLADGLGSSWGTLLKPLAWQGDLCLGPSPGNGTTTFSRPDLLVPGWRGLPPVETAGPTAVAAYLGAHGPATPAAFGAWLSGGWFGLRDVRAWFDALGDRLAAVDVDGERRFVLAEHVDELLATEPGDGIRLLPGFDQYVLAAGTSDERIVAAGRRRLVSRAGGWISPVVVRGGVVAGTWQLDRTRVVVRWFGEAGEPPRAAVEAEIDRLAVILKRDLERSVAVV